MSNIGDVGVYTNSPACTRCTNAANATCNATGAANEAALGKEKGESDLGCTEKVYKGLLEYCPGGTYKYIHKVPFNTIF